MKDCTECPFVRAHADQKSGALYYACSKGMLPNSGRADIQIFDGELAYSCGALDVYWKKRLWCVHWQEFWLMRAMPVVLSIMAFLVSLVTLVLRVVDIMCPGNTHGP